MAQRSLPWSGTVLGDAGPYSDAEWAEAWRYALGLAPHRENVGVLLGSGDSGVDGLKVRATSPATANIEVAAGSALVNGTLYINDATATLTITANNSGNPRIDTVVLRKDFSAQTVRLVVKQGTPAASPTPPSLTQTPNVTWEIPLADIAVANGFLSITNADITLRAEYANAPDGVYLDMVLNNSGGELNTGDVVVWDTTANRAVTTTTSGSDPLVAGVWVGRTANGGYGRVQVGGIGLVRVNAAVGSRTALLATSTTAKQAAVVTGGVGVFAQALETTSGAGLCLAHINAPVRTASPVQFVQTADQTIANSNAETTCFATGIGTLTLPANALAVGKTIRIKISGRYSTASSAPTITVRLKLGGSNVAVSVAETAVASASNRGFEIDALITCRSVGVTGTVIGQGAVKIRSSTSNIQIYDIVATATTTVNTTGSLAIDVTWQWSAASAANSVTITNAVVEVL